MLLKGSEKKWRKQMYFHAKRPSCWVDRAIQELESRPKAAETRGRNALLIPDEMREKRLKVMRRRASYKQRLDVELRKLRPDMKKVIHLIDLMTRTIQEVEPLGGVPVDWREEAGVDIMTEQVGQEATVG